MQSQINGLEHRVGVFPRQVYCERDLRYCLFAAFPWIVGIIHLDEVGRLAATHGAARGDCLPDPWVALASNVPQASRADCP